MNADDEAVLDSIEPATDEQITAAVEYGKMLKECGHDETEWRSDHITAGSILIDLDREIKALKSGGQWTKAPHQVEAVIIMSKQTMLLPDPLLRDAGPHLEVMAWELVRLHWEHTKAERIYASE